MRSLVVEDESTSRRVLQHLLSAFGECHVAVDGAEGVEAYESAFAEGKPYDLVCLDIMMPGLDGQEVLRRIRAFEEQHGRAVGQGAKIIMTTALGDAENVMGAFKAGCESYLVKPIQREAVLKELDKLGLIRRAQSA